MKSKYILKLIIFCLLIITPFAAYSGEIDEKEAAEFAQVQGQKLLGIFAEPDRRIKYKQLDDLFLNYVDLEHISRFVIGKYWRQMDEEQQAQYQDLFKRYATNIYKGFPLNFDKNLDFVVTSSRKEGKDVFVGTDIEYIDSSGKKSTFLVEFRMHKRDGRLMITDIKIGESSLILSYRTRFYKMVVDADEDMDWFLEDFELSTISAEKTYALPDDDED